MVKRTVKRDNRGSGGWRAGRDERRDEKRRSEERCSTEGLTL